MRWAIWSPSREPRVPTRWRSSQRFLAWITRFMTRAWDSARTHNHKPHATGRERGWLPPGNGMIIPLPGQPTRMAPKIAPILILIPCTLPGSWVHRPDLGWWRNPEPPGSQPQTSGPTGKFTRARGDGSPHHNVRFRRTGTRTRSTPYHRDVPGREGTDIPQEDPCNHGTVSGDTGYEGD